MPTQQIEDRWCQYIPNLHRASAAFSSPYVVGNLRLAKISMKAAEKRIRHDFIKSMEMTLRP